MDLQAFSSPVSTLVRLVRGVNEEISLQTTPVWRQGSGSVQPWAELGATVKSKLAFILLQSTVAQQ